MQEALLIQKIEFLESELEEAKLKEERLKSLNQSLLEALHSSEDSPLQSHTIEELQRAYTQSQQDLCFLTRKYEDLERSYEGKIKDLTSELKQRPAESLSDLKSTFNKENQALRTQNAHFQMKIKQMAERQEDLLMRNQSLEFEIQEFRKGDKNQLQQALIDREAAEIEREKTALLLKQSKLEAALNAQKAKENEFHLKEQIKCLRSREFSFHSRPKPALNISAISSTESSLVNLEDFSFF